MHDAEGRIDQGALRQQVGAGNPEYPFGGWIAFRNPAPGVENEDTFGHRRQDGIVQFVSAGRSAAGIGIRHGSNLAQASVFSDQNATSRTRVERTSP